MQRQPSELQWHWLYRDFLATYEQCPTDDLWIETYSRTYLRPHAYLLTPLHFSPKGFLSEEQALARMSQLGRQHFSPLIQAIQRPDDYEETLGEMACQLLAILRHHPRHRDMYVIVGLDCTNIYSLVHDKRDVTVFCVENVQGRLEDARLLLAHEIHHWARQASFRNVFASTLGERLVTEGLAAVFSEEVCPGRAISEYCFVPAATVKWVEEHWPHLEALISWDHLYETKLLDSLFARQPANSLLPAMPPRVGYVYGYLKVRAFLQALNRLASNAVELPWAQAWSVETGREGSPPRIKPGG